MKKVLSILLIVWSGVTNFISPIWLTLTIVNMTGMVYQYDYSMDEGTATIFGIIFAILWIVFALLPNALLIKKLYEKGKKYVAIGFATMAFLWIMCLAMCDWNIIHMLFG